MASQADHGADGGTNEPTAGNGMGPIGSAELLFKLSLYLEENDLWDAVTRSKAVRVRR